ncbi:LysR family transcriptional regulator [Roseovarius sp. 2305UL8-3]|uniref:LysR family transcriptional regulator n=1 Tax=Roseovarius conchicola TaxID=3121636 RepID=UPI00352964BB
MNITAIQTFLAVTRAGNLNRAAEQLNITQSAVTARLDTLEQAMGQRLLNRSRKGATLTKAGYAFLDQAELITSTWANARAQASLPQGVTSMFSLVCDPALWMGVGADWVAGLRNEHPDTAFDIWAGLASDARRWLQSGVSDAALLPEPLSGPEFAHRPFAMDQVVEVSSRPRAAMRWDPDYIYVDYGAAYRLWHALTWPGDDTAPSRYSNPDWALAHLLKHGGSAYLPEGLVNKHLEDGTLHPVRGAAAYERQSHLSWRKAVAPAFPWLAAD